MNKMTFVFAFFVMLLLTACNKKTTESTQAANQTEQRTQRAKRPQKGKRSADEMLSKMDANKDGKLSKTEVKGPLQEQFSTVDTNQDGFLSKTELENAPKPSRGERPRRN